MLERGGDVMQHTVVLKRSSNENAIQPIIKGNVEQGSTVNISTN